ncbi:MAG: hypothetical protein AAGA18_08805 [Verrucomicrobiota bacterium]
MKSIKQILRLTWFEFRSHIHQVLPFGFFVLMLGTQLVDFKEPNRVYTLVSVAFCWMMHLLMVTVLFAPGITQGAIYAIGQNPLVDIHEFLKTKPIHSCNRFLAKLLLCLTPFSILLILTTLYYSAGMNLEVQIPKHGQITTREMQAVEDFFMGSEMVTEVGKNNKENLFMKAPYGIYQLLFCYWFIFLASIAFILLTVMLFLQLKVGPLLFWLEAIIPSCVIMFGGLFLFNLESPEKTMNMDRYIGMLFYENSIVIITCLVGFIIVSLMISWRLFRRPLPY